MTQIKEDLVTLKIRTKSRDWFNDEQYRLKKVENEEPTHAELFDRMMRVYIAAIEKGGGDVTPAPAPQSFDLPFDVNPEDAALLQLVARVLAYDGANTRIGSLRDLLRSWSPIFTSQLK